MQRGKHTMPITVRSADFIGTLGVNTHIDFAAHGYQNLSVVEASINYLGLKNLRDSPQSAGDVGPQCAWQQVVNQTHAKFDAYIDICRTGDRSVEGLSRLWGYRP